MILDIIFSNDYEPRYILPILIMLVGTAVCARVVFVWEETGVRREYPPVRLGDHMTI